MILEDNGVNKKNFKLNLEFFFVNDIFRFGDFFINELLVPENCRIFASLEDSRLRDFDDGKSRSARERNCKQKRKYRKNGEFSRILKPIPVLSSQFNFQSLFLTGIGL